mmetsp:Transcript_3636/g.7762  ORF Transcript_3636/g.7762 Transcript_3636/m.7762 type:complete len:193 (+) Transcript_3636:33-611(+)
MSTEPETIRRLAIVEVPARVRDKASSFSAVMERMGGPHLIHHALERKVPLEFRLSSRPLGHPLVGLVEDEPSAVLAAEVASTADKGGNGRRAEGEAAGARDSSAEGPGSDKAAPYVRKHNKKDFSNGGASEHERGSGVSRVVLRLRVQRDAPTDLAAGKAASSSSSSSSGGERFFLAAAVALQCGVHKGAVL